MQRLLTLLKHIDDDDKFKNVYGYIPEYNNKIVEMASNIASEILIKNNGRCDWRNISLLEMEGYDVFPVEKYGIQWLLGGIKLRKGVITFS